MTSWSRRQPGGLGGRGTAPEDPGRGQRHR